MAAAVAAVFIAPETFRSNSKHTQRKPSANFKPSKSNCRRCSFLVGSSWSNEHDIIPVKSDDRVDQQDGAVCIEMEAGDLEMDLVVGYFGNEASGMLSFEGASGFSASGSGAVGQDSVADNQKEIARLLDRAINAALVLAAGSFAIAKLLTVDQNYWQGWTLFEILRYAPQHNWIVYEEALKSNPVLAKMVISGVVYSLGDWIAQSYEGKRLFEFDRARVLRSGLVGFTLHGSLSHYYYHFCEALFPHDDWWVVPAKVAFDQTAWSALWNSIYFTLLGVLRLESPATIFAEWKATFLPMLTAGWKLWPFAHLITYGVIPVEHRLLWVDMVELVWVTILSTYSNEKSESRMVEEAATGVGSSEEDR